MKFGAVAQLGERVLCKHEVIGSIPFSSTIFSFGGVVFRLRDDGFGMRIVDQGPWPPVRMPLLLDIVKKYVS
jgi:hypothetical protein